MRYLSIKNLAKYQHYKNRRPPWIKLHVAIFDDYAFQCLQDASKAHLMLLWLLASQMDNRIPYDLGFIARKLGTTSPIDVEELVLQGFIEVSQDDSKPLAARKQKPIVETETETETEKRKKQPPAADATDPDEPIVLPAVHWVREGAEWWRANIGDVTEPRFGAALKAMVAQHGWDAVFPAMKFYHAKLPAGKSRKPNWFAEEAARWIAEEAASRQLIGAGGNEGEIATWIAEHPLARVAR